jgi:hypothetical protein
MKKQQSQQHKPKKNYLTKTNSRSNHD